MPGAASAGPIYDFSDASGGSVTDLGASELLAGGITAYAYYLNGTTWSPSALIARNEGNDDAGLGVCSESASSCAIGGTGSGDNNELSQLTYNEAILLQRPADTLWSGLWLSSLDAGGTNNSEKGRLYWGNSSDIGTLLGGTGFSFDYPEFIGTDAYGKADASGNLRFSGRVRPFRAGG